MSKVNAPSAGLESADEFSINLPSHFLPCGCAHRESYRPHKDPQPLSCNEQSVCHRCRSESVVVVPVPITGMISNVPPAPLVSMKLGIGILAIARTTNRHRAAAARASHGDAVRHRIAAHRKPGAVSRPTGIKFKQNLVESQVSFQGIANAVEIAAEAYRGKRFATASRIPPRLAPKVLPLMSALK